MRMFKTRVAVFTGLLESCTCTVTGKVPGEPVGVPEISPVVWLIPKPGGNPVALHEYDPLPPNAATVVEYACVSVPSGSDVVVMITGIEVLPLEQLFVQFVSTDCA